MSSASRTQKAAKNFFYSSLGNAVNYLIMFISRTVFIHTLGTMYLGVEGLFKNVLGMLSLAELGVGIAISFSMYQPLAENNIKKLQALVNFYRTAYRYIAIIVALIGVALIPFLPYIIKESNDINDLTLIYLLYLANTVLSYLITYKSTILNADQKSYVVTNIHTVTTIVATLIQIIALIIFKNFIVYLLIQIIVQLVGKIYTNIVTGKLYPYLQGNNNEKLDDTEKKTIFNKIKALMVHKIGDVAINQTDSIITSAFINVTAVGLVSNFTMIIYVVNSLINTFFASAIAGLGNVVATERPERRLEVFKKYDFLGFFFFGWSSIFLFFMLSPFITIWIGEDKLVDNYTVLLLCVNFYLMGQRVSLGNIKSAAGVFEQDVWMPFAQAFINIITSIIAVKICGLPGIYIGTLLSSMVPNFGRPVIVYKYIFEKSSLIYFKEYFKRIAIMIISGVLIFFIDSLLQISSVLICLIIRFILSFIIPLVVIWLFYRSSDEWDYCISILRSIKNKVRLKHE